MATRVIDPIGQAITATEKEIAAAAWGNEEPVLDETGDRTVETMGDGLEGQHELDDDDETTEGGESEVETESEEGEGESDEGAEGEAEAAAEADDKGKPEARAEGEREGRVPSGRLREANERAKAFETQRDELKAQIEAERAESRRQFDALNARMEQIAKSMQPSPKPEEPAPTEQKAPDWFEDPAGFVGAQTKPLIETVNKLQTDIRNERFTRSLELAHVRHGDIFDKAYAASNALDPNNPDHLETGRRIFNSPNPGEAMVAWYKRNETLREVGDDPSKYRERIAAETREALMKDPEFRKSLIDGLRAEASQGSDGKPNTTVRLPRSLNGAAGGNRRDVTAVQYDDNDSAIAAAAWADTR